MFFRISCIALTCGLLAACAGGSQGQSILPGAGAPARSTLAVSAASHIDHVTVIVMENAAYESVIGNASAPFVNQFAQSNAIFTNSHGVSHPSEPNYLALFSGSTQGVTSDACPVTSGAANLATELRSAGYSFEGYVENWPGSASPCFADASSSVGSKYLYWRKHVPWADFTNVPATTVTHAYGGPGTALTGNVNFIIPNICDDMHDCSVAAGDAWLSRNIPAIQKWDAANNGLLILTFDEGEYSSTNHILTIMSGPMVKPGSYSQNITHYSVLRLIESNFGLPLLGASSSAAPISGVIAGSTTSTPTPATTATPVATAQFVRGGTVGAVFGSTVEVQFGTGCGWDHVDVSSSTVYSPSSWRPAVNEPVTVYGSGNCSGPIQATEIVKSGSTATPPPANSTEFVRTGTIGAIYGNVMQVEFGPGCGWDHVNLSSSTTYSPSSWHPAVNQKVTVRGSGNCSVPIQASQIVQS